MYSARSAHRCITRPKQPQRRYPSTDSAAQSRKRDVVTAAFRRAAREQRRSGPEFVPVGRIIEIIRRGATLAKSEWSVHGQEDSAQQLSCGVPCVGISSASSAANSDRQHMGRHNIRLAR